MNGNRWLILSRLEDGILHFLLMMMGNCICIMAAVINIQRMVLNWIAKQCNLKEQEKKSTYLNLIDMAGNGLVSTWIIPSLIRSLRVHGRQNISANIITSMDR